MNSSPNKFTLLERMTDREFMAIKGIDPVKVLEIRSMLEIMRRYAREKVSQQLQPDHRSAESVGGQRHRHPVRHKESAEICPAQRLAGRGAVSQPSIGSMPAQRTGPAAHGQFRQSLQDPGTPLHESRHRHHLLILLIPRPRPDVTSPSGMVNLVLQDAVSLRILPPGPYAKAIPKRTSPEYRISHIVQDS